MILDNIKSFFGITNAPKETEPVKEKAELGQILMPAYKIVPPPVKAGKFLTEGVKGWVYIAISAIADEVMSTPLSLFRKQGKEWLEVEEHMALDIIDRPNPFQTKEEFLWLLTVMLLAEGEAPIILDKPKNPTSMVLGNPERMDVRIVDETTFQREFIFTISNGERRVVPDQEVVFIKLPSYLSPFRGKGVLSYIGQTLDIDEYINEYLRMFFFNNARPDGVIETDKKLTQDIVDRFRSAWNRMHKGFKNAHKIAILDNGMKFHDLQKSFADLNLTAGEAALRDKILSTFKVPKSVVGIVEDVNRANGENSDRVFARRAVKPKLLLIQAQLNEFLIKKFSEGMNLWYEFDNPVQEDELLKAQIRQANILSGVRTANEYRGEDGLDPIEQEPVQEQPTNQDEQSGDNMDESADEGTGKFYKAVKDMLARSADRVFTEEEKAAVHSQKLVVSDEIETRYTAKLQSNFNRQLRIIKESLPHKSVKTLRMPLDEDEEEEMLAELSLPFIEEMIEKQAAIAAATIGMKPLISPQDDRVRAFTARTMTKLGKNATETTISDVKQIFKDWGESGLGISDLKSTLSNYFGDTARAENIARTEVSRAAGFATEETYTVAGVVGKEWITAPDERVCEFCAEMDGKIIPINENYFDKGDTVVGTEGGSLSLDYESVSSFPLHPQCRCDLLPIFSDELVKRADNWKHKMKEKTDLETKRVALEAKEEELKIKERDIRQAIKEIATL